MHNFKQDSDGQKSFPQLKTDVTTKSRNHLVPIPSQRNLAIDTSSSSSAQPSLSFHYAWYGGTGFLCVGHPGHLVPPLGLYFLCLGIIQSCLPASPVFPYLGLIFTQINLSPNTSLCTNCTFFGGKSFELGNIYIVWITSRGKYFLGHADDAELDYDDAMMPCVSVRVWDIPDICHNHHNQGSLFFQ